MFWKKPSDDQTDKAAKPDKPSDSGKGGEPTLSPEKAARFFAHAKTVGDTGNFEYAMQLWLSGLRFEPGNMTGLENFFSAAARWLGEAAGKRLDKEVAKAVSGSNKVDGYLSVLLDWAQKPMEAVLAVKATELASDLKLIEPTYWIGERALGACRLDKKTKKETFVKLMEAFQKAGVYDKAVQAGDAACKLDPADGPLSATVRNLSAQSTMNRGGFDQAGQSGGFRANIRDADKQRQLEEEDRVSKTTESIDRLLAVAEAEYLKRPDDLPSVTKYTQRLRERGTPADEAQAADILAETFKKTGQFRFRQEAGDLRLRQERRKVTALKQTADASPDDENAKATLRQAVRAFHEMELEEFQARAAAYPTDLTIKFEMGKRHFVLSNFDDAIAAFQDSQNEGKLKAMSLNLMAQAFIKQDWIDEAIETFKRTLEVKDLLPDLTLEVRYHLMTALQAKAEQSREIATAEEADKLASQIAIQQIGYRDIRARREAMKKLLAELRAKPQ